MHSSARAGPARAASAEPPRRARVRGGTQATCALNRSASIPCLRISSKNARRFFLALRAALRPGAPLGVEDESYPGALDAAHAYGAELTSLEAPAAGYYVMPSISNPRGQPLGGALRERLLSRAREFRSVIIEDDAYADTSFSGRVTRPLLADAPQRVFHIGTFSKSLCPGLRVGWIVAPERYVRRLLRAKQNNDLQANGLSQSLLVEYLEQGTFEKHKQRARRAYQRRAKRLCRALREHLPGLRFSEPAGGFSVWVETDAPSSEDRLFQLALEEGVSLDLGGAFCRSPSGRLSFRLSYSSVREEKIDDGVRRLALALQRLDRETREIPMKKTKPTPASKTPTSAAPALRNARPDKRTTAEPDARNADDKDGNESHAGRGGTSKKSTAAAR